MSNREVMVVVNAPDDLFDRPIALHDDTWTAHIRPFKADVTVEAIVSVIENVEHVYEEKGNKDRHFLVSSSVSSRTGKPLTVIVDPLDAGQHVPVCTAFYNRSPKVGPLVWAREKPESSVRSSYDSNYDILYLALGDFKSEEEEVLETGVFLGYPENGAEPKAATILRFSSLSEDEKKELADRLAGLLHVPVPDVGAALRVN